MFQDGGKAYRGSDSRAGSGKVAGGAAFEAPTRLGAFEALHVIRPVPRLLHKPAQPSATRMVMLPASIARTT